jgi:uncharacterized membrane protein YdbT with pleckstrin-like domain
MEVQETNNSGIIDIRPSAIFAFIKILPFIICAVGLLLLAWRYIPGLLVLSFICLFMAVYRYLYIRNVRYTLTSEVIRITRGIFFKRTDQVELFRVKDYILTQSFILQVFKLMDLTLKSTDPENPVIWLRGIPESDLVDTIRDHVQAFRQHNRIYEIN